MQVITVEQQLRSNYGRDRCKDALTAPQIDLRARFFEGLAAYRARLWEDARCAFSKALAAVPNDGPSLAFIRRVEAFGAAPPAKDWDGSWRLEEK